MEKLIIILISLLIIFSSCTYNDEKTSTKEMQIAEQKAINEISDKEEYNEVDIETEEYSEVDIETEEYAKESHARMVRDNEILEKISSLKEIYEPLTLRGLIPENYIAVEKFSEDELGYSLIKEIQDNVLPIMTKYNMYNVWGNDNYPEERYEFYYEATQYFEYLLFDLYDYVYYELADNYNLLSTDDFYANYILLKNEFIDTRYEMGILYEDGIGDDLQKSNFMFSFSMLNQFTEHFFDKKISVSISPDFYLERHQLYAVNSGTNLSIRNYPGYNSNKLLNKFGGQGVYAFWVYVMDNTLWADVGYGYVPLINVYLVKYPDFEI